MILSFIVAGVVSGLAAICYAEFASTVPIAGSAYTYSYATLGELIAWIIGWDLILEYAVGAAAVSIGWSGYVVDLLKGALGITIPKALTISPFAGGITNLPAVLIILLITALLILGTSESARVNNIIVIIKLAVIVFFLVVGFGHINPANWSPFLPFGVGGIFRGASIIFFAYIGFDQISTSAEESRNPARDLPIGIFSSLLICTVLYILVTAVLTGIVSYKALDVASPVSHALILIGLNASGAIIAVGLTLRFDDSVDRVALRAEPHLLLDGARRSAARLLLAHSSSLPHALSVKLAGWHLCGSSGWPDSHRDSGRTHEYRHAVRICTGLSGGTDHAAHAASAC